MDTASNLGRGAPSSDGYTADAGVAGRPVRVAVVCDDLMVGGWTSLVAMLSNLPPDIHPVVFCLFGKGHNAEILERRGIPVRCLYLSKRNLAIRVCQLALVFRSEKIDIVHTQLYFSHVVGGFAATLAGVRRRIMHVHSMPSPMGLAARILTWLALGRCDLVTPVSRAAAAAFAAAWPAAAGKIRVLDNGIDADWFAEGFGDAGPPSRAAIGIPEGKFVVAAVTNLKWQKGHEYLIEAAALLDESCHLLFVGHGEREVALRRLAAERGVAERVSFLGVRTDVPAILANCDAFVLPSVSEAFGICLLEAFAAGLPVVASEVGGIPEVVGDDGAAILVPPGDPRALAAALTRLRDEPESRRRLAVAGRKRLKAFDIKSIAETYAGLCRELVNSWPRHPRGA